MSYAVVVEDIIVERLQAEIEKIDGTTNEWRFDLRGHITDVFPKAPDQVDKEQSPVVCILPGDLSSEPGMSRRRTGTFEVLVGAIIRPDADRLPDETDPAVAKKLRKLALELWGDLRKAIQQLPTVNCSRQVSIKADLIVDPLGRFATLGISVLYDTVGNFGA